MDFLRFDGFEMKEEEELRKGGEKFAPRGGKWQDNYKLFVGIYRINKVYINSKEGTQLIYIEKETMVLVFH